MAKKAWEKSPQKLIDVFYEVMIAFPDAELRKMFGYPCAFINGNMFAGLHESNLAIRLSIKDRENALSQNYGGIFAPIEGRIMKEYVCLSEKIIYQKNELKEWISKSLHYSKTLPPKVKK